MGVEGTPGVLPECTAPAPGCESWKSTPGDGMKGKALQFACDLSRKSELAGNAVMLKKKKQPVN